MCLSILKNFCYKDVEYEGFVKVGYCVFALTGEGMCFRKNPKTLRVMTKIFGYTKFTKASHGTK